MSDTDPQTLFELRVWVVVHHGYFGNQRRKPARHGRSMLHGLPLGLIELHPAIRNGLIALRFFEIFDGGVTLSEQESGGAQFNRLKNRLKNLLRSQFDSVTCLNY